MNKLTEIYNILLEEYGRQGWWPLQNFKGVNPTKTGSIEGYHPGDFDFPKNNYEQFEICVGAILAQNTSWTNVEKALANLSFLKSLSAKSLLSLDFEVLKTAIKPAGFFNQKSRTLVEFAKFFKNLTRSPSRAELLSLWGVGPETADSILLYAFKVSSFVIDSYTKRIFSRLAFIDSSESYDIFKAYFELALPEDFEIYQEYHALIVEHAKRFCLSKPNCDACILKRFCKFNI